jgi:hypothetical protein
MTEDVRSSAVGRSFEETVRPHATRPQVTESTPDRVRT